MTITEHIQVVRPEAAPVSPWRRWLGPAGFVFFGLVDILVFGLFAHKGDASFAFSQPFAKVPVPDLDLPADVTCLGCGAASLVLAVVLPFVPLPTRWRRVCIGVVLLAFILSSLGWAAA